MTAYTYARVRVLGRAESFNFDHASRLLPTVAPAVPFYTIVQGLELVNSSIALLLIYRALPNCLSGR